MEFWGLHLEFWGLHLHGWIALAVTLGVFVALQLRRRVPTDLLFLSGLAVVTLTGVITPEQALAGFANPAVLTVGALFVVAAGLRNTGVLDWVGHKLLGSSHSEGSALRRLAAALIPASAFMPNTPLVAMALPVVLDWCRKRGISPSRLLIPVSYLAILGGVCTVIGTSTTLLVDGMLRSEYQLDEQRAEADQYPDEFREQIRGMWLLEIGYVGLPCALVGAGALLLFGRRLLPDRQELVQQYGERRREYLVQMRVLPQCRLIGQSVRDAGLRQLPGLFLIEINRDGEIITPVTPNDVICENDLLVFTGVVTTIVDLERIPGLVATTGAPEESPTKRGQRHLTEAVLSRSSPLIGRTVRDAHFRRRYGAAVVAVHRDGVRLTNKIGNITLEPGDTLLLQTRRDFVDTFRHSRDFYLVSGVEGSTPMRHDRAPLATALVVILIVWLIGASWIVGTGLAGLASPAIAALTIAVLMVATRCLPMPTARGALDIHVLLTLVGAIGLGRALTESGASSAIAGGIVGTIGDHPYLLLVVVYLLAMLLTELVTNNAVAAMLIPLAIALAANVPGLNPRPYIMAVALAASLSFLTPIGYQTNLMVMGPGGYRPLDYLRAGWPLALLVMLTALALIPYMWPLRL